MKINSHGFYTAVMCDICTNLVDQPYCMIYTSFLNDSYFTLLITSVSTSYIEHVSCDLAFISMYGCQTLRGVVCF